MALKQTLAVVFITILVIALFVEDVDAARRKKKKSKAKAPKKGKAKAKGKGKAPKKNSKPCRKGSRNCPNKPGGGKNGSGNKPPSTITNPPDAFSSEILNSHNLFRSQAGIGALQWDSQLESNARNQAGTGPFMTHTPCSGVKCGQNLWAGTSGFYQPRDMVGNWVSEGPENNYVCDVLTDANWYPVGHYTQVMWAGTTRVGCAMVPREGMDYLVCNYAPAGNVLGQRPFNC
jgi:hypothetical protein